MTEDSEMLNSLESAQEAMQEALDSRHTRSGRHQETEPRRIRQGIATLSSHGGVLESSPSAHVFGLALGTRGLRRYILGNTSNNEVRCMFSSRDISVAFLVCIAISYPFAVAGADFDVHVKPLLSKYCVKCHGGEEANGDVDFSKISTTEDIDTAFETWESVVRHLRAGTMPPQDQAQPDDEERNRFFEWYQNFVDNVEVQPAVFQSRRLSANEYRNTLRSLFGFDLQVAIIEAEQTIAQRSMVLKLAADRPARQEADSRMTLTRTR